MPKKLRPTGPVWTSDAKDVLCKACELSTDYIQNKTKNTLIYFLNGKSVYIGCYKDYRYQPCELDAHFLSTLK